MMKILIFEFAGWISLGGFAFCVWVWAEKLYKIMDEKESTIKRLNALCAVADDRIILSVVTKKTLPDGKTEVLRTRLLDAGVAHLRAWVAVSGKLGQAEICQPIRLEGGSILCVDYRMGEGWQHLDSSYNEGDEDEE